MSLTGRQKSQLLISIIEDKSVDVLKHLSEESATLLTSILDDAPSITDEEMNDYLDLVLDLVNENQLNLEEDNEPETSRDDFLGMVTSAPSEESFDDNDLFNEIDETMKSPFPDTYRPVEEIAQKLEDQNDQMVAFFFAHAEETLADAIKEYLSSEKITAFESCNVLPTPMSERVFSRLFDMIVLKSKEELQAQESKESVSNEEDLSLEKPNFEDTNQEKPMSEIDSNDDIEIVGLDNQEI